MKGFYNVKAILTLPMLRLLLYKGIGCKDFCKPSKPCHVGIHKVALTECSQMSTYMPGFQSFSMFCASFCNARIRLQPYKD